MQAKNILITGGSGGLGLAIAVALNNAGHSVAVTGRDEAKLKAVSKTLPGALALQADVTDAAATLAAVEQVRAAIGPVDVLINNAGIGGSVAPLVDTDVDSWWQVQETNVKGPMLYSKAVLPDMIERGSGIIVNIGSYIAIRPTAMATAYGTSKAALARFSDCLAEEVADQGVQVFCVSPGLVLTDIVRDVPFINDIPQSEFHQPDEIAQLVSELVTGDYGALSGRFIHVDDKLQDLLQRAEKIEAGRLYQLCLHGLTGLID